VALSRLLVHNALELGVVKMPFGRYAGLPGTIS
jgi:hypothetical protein